MQNGLAPRSSRPKLFAASANRVAAGVPPAVEGGILPPGILRDNLTGLKLPASFPPGGTPGSTAGRMPAANLHSEIPTNARSRFRRPLADKIFSLSLDDELNKPSCGFLYTLPTFGNSSTRLSLKAPHSLFHRDKSGTADCAACKPARRVPVSLARWFARRAIRSAGFVP